MNSFSIFKEKVRSVIEAHGGRVDIDIIPGIIVQPSELRPTYNFTHDYFQPVELVFNGTNLKINVTSGLYDEIETRELLKRLQAIVSIMDEIKVEEKVQHIINPTSEQLKQHDVHEVKAEDVYCTQCGEKLLDEVKQKCVSDN